MKKFLLSSLAAVMLCSMLLAEDYYTVLDQAEKWIDSTYNPGSLANRRAKTNLIKLDEAQGSEAEKIANIKKAFPNAFKSESAKPAQPTNSSSAQDYFYKGVEYYKNKNYPEAVKWFRKAAEQGDAKAQCMLGVCYDNGQGVSQDYAEAVKWYRKAAEQGDAMAQYNLGVCYYNGQGVSQNYAEAVKWLRKAAAQGHAGAKKVLKELNE